MLAQPPEVHTSTVTASKVCAPSASSAAGTKPAILLAHYEYEPSTVADALRSWKDVVDYVVKNEYWTTGYTVGEEKDKSTVRTVETYEGWEFLEKVHAKSEVVLKSAERTGRNAVGKGAVRVVAVDGFLGREGRARL